MSWQPAPSSSSAPSPCDPLARVLEAKPKDLGGGFMVRRVLPAAKHRRVGPFLFFDHMGPAEIPPGEGLSVRPHPHIHLETITYLFEGAIMHRDSLGSAQRITPGALNWMTAGRGIVHSERRPEDEKERTTRLHGIQAWVALPEAQQDVAPDFLHVPATELPVVRRAGATLRVIAGEAYGARSPAPRRASLFYAEAQLEAGASVAPPEGFDERAFYVVEGEVRVAGASLGPGRLGVLRPGAQPTIEATVPSRLMLLGGEDVGTRHLWWNFASTSKEAIEQAKRDWKEEDHERFPLVPGDEAERIPLPES